jgi:DNA-3-methyladenine glycosylase II
MCRSIIKSYEKNRTVGVTIFKYGEIELNYLKEQDKKLKYYIEKYGLIERKIEPDIYKSVIHQILGQQISMKAQETIWTRFQEKYSVTPQEISKKDLEELKQIGISEKKAEYILDFSKKVETKEINLNSFKKLTNEEIINELTKSKGIGVWTAEMILIFSLGRKDVLSYNDYGIKQGMIKLYHHRKITKEIFNKHKKKYHPYETIASFYLWKINQEEKN